MIPQKTVEELISKHSLLEKDLSSGNLDKKLFAEKSKEYSDLNEIINDAKKYISFEKNKNEIEKILKDENSDEELLKMAETELKDLQDQFEKNVGRPDFWGGIRIKPVQIEFWADGQYRLHDRFLWERKLGEKSWSVRRLYP